MRPLEDGFPSDDEPDVLATGTGDVRLAVFSMAGSSPDGRDDEYVRWHLLDHLPEQHRLTDLRWGQRWRATPELRAARAVAVEPFAAVDHVVNYLFADPDGDGLDEFFALGGALHRAGRMPLRLPSVHLAGWTPIGRAAAPRVKVGADVVPFRPNRGVYLVIERDSGPEPPLDELLDRPGVAGYWRHRGGDHHPRLVSAGGLVLTVAYLDADPAAVAESFRPIIDEWPRAVLLAAPFAVATVATVVAADV